MKPVERWGLYAETSRYCPHCRDGPYSIIHSVESMLEYCNGFGPVCFNTHRHLLRAGLVARMPLHRLPLSRDHQCLRLQWTEWRAEWQNVIFSDESRFNISYNDGHIHVWRYTAERNLRACILQQHRGPTPSVMVWDVIGYNMWSRLLHIEGIWTATATLGRFYSPRYCPSFRQLHMSYFSRTMPSHMWQGLC